MDVCYSNLGGYIELFTDCRTYFYTFDMRIIIDILSTNYRLRNSSKTIDILSLENYWYVLQKL